MAKRKSSASEHKTTSTAAAESQPATHIRMVKAEIDAKMKEHRDFLLANAGVKFEESPEPLPPSKKRKTIAKKSVVEAKDDTHEDEAGGAKPAASEPVTPRNAATSKKPKAVSEKRKISEAATDNANACDSQLTGEAKHDSATDADEPKPKKMKGTPKKRKTGDAPADEQDARASTPSKKRRASPKSKKAKGSDTFATPPAPAPPQPKPLSFGVAAKVQSVYNFLNSVPQEHSMLIRDSNHPNLFSIPERDLIAALMRVRADYEIGDRYDAHLAQIQSAIVQQWTASVQLTLMQGWVKIDVEAPMTELESEVQEAVEGHGLEDVNLLEVECEMLALEKRRQAGLWHAAEAVSAPGELQRAFDETLAAVRVRETMESMRQAALRKAGEAVSAPDQLQRSFDETLAAVRERERVEGEERELARSQGGIATSSSEPEELCETPATEVQADQVMASGGLETWRGVCPPSPVSIV